ncbi:MAG: hypothetical protein RL338_954 [Chloroflexota bacterium]
MASGGLDALAAAVVAACRERGLSVATVESCTGGLVADSLTDVAGSSEVFLGGLVVYADAAKRELAGVDARLIAAHGAVSAEVAGALARGGRDRLGADLAVGVTGIAGPGGGSVEKPVGLTYVAISTARSVRVERHRWRGGRAANKRASARAALRLLLAAAEASR